MLISKYMTTDELEVRRHSVSARINHIENRLRNPPPHACWNKRLDMANVADLSQYLDAINEELEQRTKVAVLA